MPTYQDIVTASANDVLSVNYLNQIIDNYVLWNEHDHAPSSGEGGEKLKVASAVASALERCYFSPRQTTEFYVASMGAQGVQPHAASGMLGMNAWGFGMIAQNASGDWASIQMHLFRGTYSLSVLYIPNPCGGTACISMVTSNLGTSELGVIDTYSASVGSSITAVINNIVVASTASYALQFHQKASNASSTGCRIEFGTLTLTKTVK